MDTKFESLTLEEQLSIAAANVDKWRSVQRLLYAKLSAMTAEEKTAIDSVITDRAITVEIAPKEEEERTDLDA